MLISILIPTYKRLPFLQRVVADVFAQTYQEWEVVISDDEVEEGETWEWLKGLVAKDQRFRIFKNEGSKHGQVFNVNNGLKKCRGEWIKVLFDDDGMLPNCLEKMVAVAKKVPQAAMIGCRAQKWRNGVYVGDEDDFMQGADEVISQDDCQMAILKFDRWNGRTPTHMLVRNAVVKAGALMPIDERYKTPVDVVWFSRVLRFGSYAMLREVLVQQREGEVASVTSAARADEQNLDGELFLSYRDIYDDLPLDQQKRISWRAIEGEINGIRGIYHLKCGRISLGLKMILKMFKSLHAPFLTLRWLLQTSFPRHFHATRRLSS